MAVASIGSAAVTGGPRLFFIHVMKTGGTTFLDWLRAQFGPGEVYPDPAQDADEFAAYHEMHRLFALPASRTVARPD